MCLVRDYTAKRQGLASGPRPRDRQGSGRPLFKLQSRARAARGYRGRTTERRGLLGEGIRSGGNEISPTARTLIYLRKHGYRAATVEKWNPHAKIRQDLFHFIDLIAVGEGRIWGVQVAMMGDRTRRLEKLTTPPVEAAVRDWLVAGGRVSIIAWTKHQPKKGRVRNRWTAVDTRLGLRWPGSPSGGVVETAMVPWPPTAPRGRRESSRPTWRGPAGTPDTTAAPGASRESTSAPRGSGSGPSTVGAPESVKWRECPMVSLPVPAGSAVARLAEKSDAQEADRAGRFLATLLWRAP